MILVTGVSCSGSTFLTRLLGELGFELGEVLDNERLARGAEWGELAQLLSEWEAANSPMPLTIHGTDTTHYLTRPTMERFFLPAFRGDTLTRLDQLTASMPEVVKSSIICRWLDAWLTLGGKRPEHVIVCHRPLEQVTESFIRDRLAGKGESDREEVRAWLSMSYGMLMDALHKWDLEYTAVSFPASVDSAVYVGDKLAEAGIIGLPGNQVTGFPTLFASHAALVDPDLIHVKEENDGTS